MFCKNSKSTILKKGMTIKKEIVFIKLFISNGKYLEVLLMNIVDNIVFEKLDEEYTLFNL